MHAFVGRTRRRIDCWCCTRESQDTESGIAWLHSALIFDACCTLVGLAHEKERDGAITKWQPWKMDGCPYLNAVPVVASGKHGHLVNKVMSSCNKQGVAGQAVPF